MVVLPVFSVDRPIDKTCILNEKVPTSRRTPRERHSPSPTIRELEPALAPELDQGIEYLWLDLASSAESSDNMRSDLAENLGALGTSSLNLYFSM